jgi:DNA-binding NarL/FixJ family response regulator
LNGKQLLDIIELVKAMPKGIPLSAFLHTLLQANSSGTREMVTMSEASLKAVLEEFSEKYGFTAEWEAKGREEERSNAVRRMQKHGMEPGQIAEVLELPLETVFKYL